MNYSWIFIQPNTLSTMISTVSGSDCEATRSYYLLGNEVPEDLESFEVEIQCLNDVFFGELWCADVWFVCIV